MNRQPITEAQLLVAIVRAACLGGYRVAHFRPARTEAGWRTPVQGDGAGFPDLVLAHPGRGELLFRELKSKRGRLTPAQSAWLETLHAAGADVAVWRPADLDDALEQLTHGKLRA